MVNKQLILPRTRRIVIELLNKMIQPNEGVIVRVDGPLSLRKCWEEIIIIVINAVLRQTIRQTWIIRLALKTIKDDRFVDRLRLLR